MTNNGGKCYWDKEPVFYGKDKSGYGYRDSAFDHVQ